MITLNGKIYDGVAMKPELDDALRHYGVLGMRWGVRRAEKKGGVRTKKKAKVFNDLYAKRKVATSKEEKKALKLQMKKAYKDLKRAKLIDKGEKLSKQGVKKRKVAGDFALSGASFALGNLNTQLALKDRAEGDDTGANIWGALAGLQYANAGSNLASGIAQRRRNVALEAYEKEKRKNKKAGK